MCCIIKTTLPKTNALSHHYYTSSYKDIRHSVNLVIEDRDGSSTLVLVLKSALSTFLKCLMVLSST